MYTHEFALNIGHQDSPLYGYLPIGSVVYKVGDDTLDNPGGAAAGWEALLSHQRNASVPALGWCIEEPWFAGASMVPSSAGMVDNTMFSTQHELLRRPTLRSVLSILLRPRQRSRLRTMRRPITLP